MNPRELVEHALELLLAKDMAAFAGLWAEDGILEFPFAAPGYPPRLDGRAAVADYLRGYPDVLDVREIPAKMLHQTDDPEVVIAEFEAAGIVVATEMPQPIGRRVMFVERPRVESIVAQGLNQFR